MYRLDEVRPVASSGTISSAPSRVTRTGSRSEASDHARGRCAEVRLGATEHDEQRHRGLPTSGEGLHLNDPRNNGQRLSPLPPEQVLAGDVFCTSAFAHQLSAPLKSSPEIHTGPQSATTPQPVSEPSTAVSETPQDANVADSRQPQSRNGKAGCGGCGRYGWVQGGNGRGARPRRASPGESGGWHDDARRLTRTPSRPSPAVWSPCSRGSKPPASSMRLNLRGGSGSGATTSIATLTRWASSVWVMASEHVCASTPTRRWPVRTRVLSPPPL